MPADQTFSTSDLRSSAQDYKRDAAHKHKWALGQVETIGRGPNHPRPVRTRDVPAIRSRPEHFAHMLHARKRAHKHDVIDVDAGSDSSARSSDTEERDAIVAPDATAIPPDAGVMYSFDASRGPSQGSQILNVALARAVQRFEEKETLRIVRSEYDVLDSEGEIVLVAAGKKGKGADRGGVGKKADLVDDEEYEFV